MRALLFGSIGTIIETSELQREAFNRAFERHGLDWRWDREVYRTLLGQSGGRARIESYARDRGETVDAAEVHKTKTELFQTMLEADDLPLRDGVFDLLATVMPSDLVLGFVSGTEQATVERIVAILQANTPGDPITGSVLTLARGPFEIVTHRQLGLAAKPDPAVYRHALERLGIGAFDALAIEDNRDGVAAAKAAGIPVLGFPGANTPSADMAEADAIVSGSLFEALRADIASLPRAVG